MNHSPRVFKPRPTSSAALNPSLGAAPTILALDDCAHQDSFSLPSPGGSLYLTTALLRFKSKPPEYM
jgi:hypothetical protein